MTIEKEFFVTFGIEPFIYCCKPRLDCSARSEGTCAKECEYYSGILYPQITAEILLKLICIGSTIYPYCLNYCETKEELKDFILNFFIRHKKEVNKKQVKALFEEGK